MHRLPRVSAIAALIFLPFVACSSDSGSPYEPEPVETIGDPATYFGVTPCRCLEFIREDGSFGNDLGIAVERVTDVFSGALEGEGLEYHVLRYRIGGMVRRTDLLRPTDPDLLLAGVNVGGDDWDNLIRIDPPVPFLRFPLDKQTNAVRLETTTEAAPSGVFSEDPKPLSYRADFAPGTAFFATDGGASAQGATIQVFYGALPWPETTRHVVAGTGLVKLELDLGDGKGKTSWVLKRVRQLGGGCPWNGETIPNDQICGISF